MPPIKGCIQASMVLEDVAFQNMTHSQWKTAVDPKVNGSWNLHSLLPHGLDFFLIFSSAAGNVGSPGQANYAAGNTYQDALAHYRVAHGEKAVAIDLGPIASDGYLSAEGAGNIASVVKMFKSTPITRNEYLALLDHYCNASLPLLSLSSCQLTFFLHNGYDPADWMKTPFASLLVLSTRISRHSYVTGATDQAMDILENALDNALQSFHSA